MEKQSSWKFLLILLVFPFLSMTCHSFQILNNNHHHTSSSYATIHRESRKEVFKKNRNINRSFATYLLPDEQEISNNNNNDQKTKSKNYNDDAFGFVFLGCFLVTEDPFFAGIFLVFSTLATIGTQNGILPAKNSVPAAVAGFTLLVSLLIPNEQLYELLPFVDGIFGSSSPSPSQQMGIDPSLIKVGFCSVSMIYGFFFSSDKEES
jgi:hypothetical protein